MSDTVHYPQFSAEGLPLTYVPDPLKADGKPVDSQWKQPVRVATGGNITLSGLQTVDGVGVMEGDRILVKDQINVAENGIWIASAGNWYRAPDMRFWEQVVAAVVAVEEGATPGKEVFMTAVSASGTVGVTDIFWVAVNQDSGTLPTYTPLRALVTDAVGAAVASPTTSQEIAYVSGVTSAIQTQFAALDNKATGAYSIAQTGTNLGAVAFVIAVDGTNAAASAQSTADSAFDIAVDGTNAAATAQSTANSAFSVAIIGTNTGSAAYSYASQAYTLAEAGTNIGSLAYTVATALGEKYVRTTRFASIGAGTSGAVTLPANAIVVLDDFGGGVDAVVTTISVGRPTFSHAFTVTGDLVTTSFDAGGNYSFSAAPSAYPVALVYRVRQKLSEFDSTSSDIIGDYDVEGINVVQGTVDQVYINGSTTPQYGNAIFSLPQPIGTNSSPTFANVYSSNIATIENTANSAFSIAQIGTNTGTAALGAAATAQSTADFAYYLAQVGTNTGTAAYQLAESGSNLASVAYALAQLGTVASGVLQTANITNGTTAVVTNTVYLADATSGSVVAQLPAASASRQFHAYVKKVDATGNYVYVRASGANTLDGTSEKFFNVQYTAIHVVCNGTNWFIL